ncbi:TRAP transporter substrate-binding protein [Aureimonas populi]|uniref:TRAP transporter substrate-binding protein n=1 Tax=Aureimonas populi TaxID=1701758 RepID=A0ABW5CJY3_9HYPH|nr:TRAP transporter substrate-binding protein [Aureimonas populi]
MTQQDKPAAPSQAILASRRKFMSMAGLGGAAAASTLAAPAVVRAQSPIRWRLQTYSGAPLGAHVIKPQIDAFNAAANGEMEIELYYADQLVPTGELFRALQNGTIDAVQSDEATMASPVDIAVFGGYFPFATRYSLDVPALFHYYGLNEVWEEAYAEVPGITWLSTGAWDPLHIFTREPIRSLADMRGKRVFGVPTAGRFLSRYGLIPVTVPWDDVEVGLQTGQLDGVAWCGFTEAYEVGWADVCNYALTNSLTGAWFGSYFANTQSWERVPPHLQQLFRTTIDQSHYYRNVWYWGGEARLRVEGEKMELTALPAEEWNQVSADAVGFWEEIAGSSPRAQRVVQAFRDYTQMMEKAGYPYR